MAVPASCCPAPSRSRSRLVLESDVTATLDVAGAAWGSFTSVTPIVTRTVSIWRRQFIRLDRHRVQVVLGLVVVGDAGLGRDLPRRDVKATESSSTPSIVQARVCSSKSVVLVMGSPTLLSDGAVLGDAAGQRGVGEEHIGAAGAGAGPVAVAVVIDRAHLHLVGFARRQALDSGRRLRDALRAGDPECRCPLGSASRSFRSPACLRSPAPSNSRPGSFSPSPTSPPRSVLPGTPGAPSRIGDADRHRHRGGAAVEVLEP